MSSTLSPPDAGLLAWYDALDEDPPGHRLEVLEGSLVVTPSPSREHQDRARGLDDAETERARADRAEAALRRLQSGTDREA